MKRNGLWIVALAIFLLPGPALPAGGGPASASITVELLPEAEISGKTVTLGKIARIRGESQKARSRIGRIRLGTVPARGGMLRISRKRVRQALQRAGVRKFDMKGERFVRVSRPADYLRRAQVESAVRRFLARRIRGADVKIESVEIPRQRILLPGGSVQILVAASPNTRFLGKTPLAVIVKVQGREYRRFWVSADIAVFVQVPVPRRPIGANERIRPQHFEMRRMNLANLPQDVVTRPADLEGAKASRALAPGQVVRMSDVELPYLVRRGHLVRVVAKRGALSITALGKALDRGRKGQIIRVLNIDSNRLIQARIINRGSVEVLF